VRFVCDRPVMRYPGGYFQSWIRSTVERNVSVVVEIEKIVLHADRLAFAAFRVRSVEETQHVASASGCFLWQFYARIFPTALLIPRIDVFTFPGRHGQPSRRADGGQRQREI
jgi:hypothetical protein